MVRAGGKITGASLSRSQTGRAYDWPAVTGELENPAAPFPLRSSPCSAQKGVAATRVLSNPRLHPPLDIPPPSPSPSPSFLPSRVPRQVRRASSSSASNGQHRSRGVPPAGPPITARASSGGQPTPLRVPVTTGRPFFSHHIRPHHCCARCAFSQHHRTPPLSARRTPPV